MPSRPTAEDEAESANVSFRAPTELVRRFDEMVRARDLDRTKVLRQLMRAELERWDAERAKAKGRRR